MLTITERGYGKRTPVEEYRITCLLYTSNRVNLIYGDNAQGKTNLLEAIAYLSSARSHRTRFDRELIRMGVDSAFLKGEVYSLSLIHIYWEIQ